MKVNSNSSPMAQMQSVQTQFTEKISKEEAQALKEQVMQNVSAIANNSFGTQVRLRSNSSDFMQAYEEFQSFLKDIGYNGKNIAELSQDEAAKLVSEDGFFGIEKTAQRISDFVIQGANEDAQKFRAGREGVLQGYEMAQEMWGGELPEISQKTLQSALESIDKAMYDLGFSILNKEA
ncbi:MAG: hypothetical protein JXQ67_01790 [Campylobacterales bacterium]|nr:hypothetical protein [Campylobacterales bacterium]